jgi:hypothetical protein
MSGAYTLRDLPTPPFTMLASGVFARARFLRRRYAGFEHLYARHANTRKPVSVAVSAMAYKRVRISLQSLWTSTYKRVGSGLQVCTFWLTTGVIPGLHRAFNSCRQMPDSWRQCRRCRNLNAALAACLRLALVRRQGTPKISLIPRGCPGPMVTRRFQGP